MKSAIDAPSCGSCGHLFSTLFQAPQQQAPPTSVPTTAYQVPQQPYAMPQQPAYGYVPPTITSNGHSPVIALLLGIFLPCLSGIAHMYNKQYGKGFLTFFMIGGISGMSWFIFFGSSTAEFPRYQSMIWTMWTIAGLGHLVYIVDSFLISKKLSEGRIVRPWDFF